MVDERFRAFTLVVLGEVASYRDVGERVRERPRRRATEQVPAQLHGADGVDVKEPTSMKIYARRHHADAPEEFGVGAAVHKHAAHVLLRLILNLFFDIREDRLKRGKPYRFQERRPRPTTW